MTRFSWLIFCFFVACSDDGGASPSDSGASPVDAGAADLGQPDSGEMDAGAADRFTLTVAIEGSGQGTVQDVANGVACSSMEAPCSFDLPVGTQLSLTPTPDMNSTFSMWQDAICSALGEAICVFNVEAAVPLTVRAVFSD